MIIRIWRGLAQLRGESKEGGGGGPERGDWAEGKWLQAERGGIVWMRSLRERARARDISLSDGAKRP